MLDSRKFYVNKDVFGVENITMVHVRLLVLLTSYKGITLGGLNKEQKMWVVKNASKYSTLPQVEQDLINNGLLFDNGKSKSVKGNFISFDTLEELKNVKNLRQLFMMSIDKWHNNSEVFITKDMLKNLFGKQLYRLNENWERTCEQLGVNYTWKEVNNSIIITVAKQEEVNIEVNPMMDLVNELVVEEIVVEEVKEVVVEDVVDEIVVEEVSLNKEQERINALNTFGIDVCKVNSKLNGIVVVDGIEYEPYNKWDMIETERCYVNRVAKGDNSPRKYLAI